MFRSGYADGVGMREYPKTDAMQQYPGSGEPADSRGPLGAAGFVLLFAQNYHELAPAWPLSRSPATVGRDETAEVWLPVNAVSRRHAEVSLLRGGWHLRDLGSTNGILVDGRRIDECALEPLAELRVGDAILKLVTTNIEEYAAYRIDGVMPPGLSRRCREGTQLAGGMQMDRIAAEVERLAPLELAVVVEGESGTGKELVARELHQKSDRVGEFRAVNCAAIPPSLLESELFGFRRGAFTGADRDHPGLFRAAHRGTLLLDEIGDMPLAAQAKLLRVLQTKEVVPLGATHPEPVDVRIVCATHRDLRRLLAMEAFRQDLYARLAEATLRLPPLRERKEDVFLLVRTFLARHGRPELEPTFASMLALLHYEWPLNVRELESCIKRAAALCEGSTLTPDLLPDPVREVMVSYGQPVSLDMLEPSTNADAGAPTESTLRDLLTRHRGNVAAVGRELGKARMQIHRWMRRYDIDVTDYR
jgi:DNA-binding NtrC family response regulator